MASIHTLPHVYERAHTNTNTHTSNITTQVARQVDLLDGRLREEQESSLKALEALLQQSGLPATLKGSAASNVAKMLPDQGAVAL